MIATATHDTKRGEDTRARLLALAQQPAEMRKLWSAWEAALRRHGFDGLDRSDLFMVFQNVIGAWPLDHGEAKQSASFADRVRQFIVKALREGKVRSSWAAPQTDYEERLCAAATALLEDERFLRDTVDIRTRVNVRGMHVSLSRTVLKCTIPGVPDFYQGCEGWDLSLVDPDNRRPAAFDIPAGTQGELSHLVETWADGRVKCELTRRLLQLRNGDPDLFAFGSYDAINLPPSSPWIAFRRSHEGESLIVAALRYIDPQWAKLRLPDMAYRDLSATLNLRGMQNVLVDNSRNIGTAATWQEFSDGLPFCIMRSIG